MMNFLESRSLSMCMIAAQRSIVKWQARSHVLTPPSLLPIFKHKAFELIYQQESIG